MLKRFKKRPPVQKAIYLLVTIFGGAVLILLLILLGLLYWMNAPAPMPGAGQYVPDDAVAWAIFHIGPVEEKTDRSGLLDYDLAGFLAHGAPPQVANLIRKGIRNPKCRIMGTASWTPGKEGLEPTLAVSLSRGPGLFHLVRRDLERRVEKNLLSTVLTYHDEKPIFVSTDNAPFNTLSFTGCSVLRATDADAMTTLLDLPKTRKPWQLDFPTHHSNTGELLLLNVAGGMEGWQPEVFSTLPDTPNCRALQVLAEKLASAVPELSKIERVSLTVMIGFDMDTAIDVTLRGDQEILTQAVAERLRELLRREGAALGIIPISAKTSPNNQKIDLQLRIEPKEEKNVPADAGDGP